MKLNFLSASTLAGLFLSIIYSLLTNLTKVDMLTKIILEGKAMGTFWRVSMIDVAPERANELRNKIQAQLDVDDMMLSTYKRNSALMCFNQSRSTAPWPVSEAIADIVTKSLRIGHKTNGAMDITIGPLVNLWGFWPR